MLNHVILHVNQYQHSGLYYQKVNSSTWKGSQIFGSFPFLGILIRFQVTAFSGNASILLHYRPLIGLCILQDFLGKTIPRCVKY